LEEIKWQEIGLNSLWGMIMENSRSI
jgi:hypothetical protein